MNEDTVLSVLLLVVLCGLLASTYKLGRYLERKDLTQYFEEMTVQTYYDGYKDGLNERTRFSTFQETH